MCEAVSGGFRDAVADFAIVSKRRIPHLPATFRMTAMLISEYEANLFLRSRSERFEVQIHR
jgi:hypothetical protein